MSTCLRQVRRGGAIVSLDDVGSIIIDLIREGRRLLTNSYQVSLFVTLLLIYLISSSLSPNIRSSFVVLGSGVSKQGTLLVRLPARVPTLNLCVALG